MLEVITFFLFIFLPFFFFYSLIEISLQTEIFLIIHIVILHENIFKEVKKIGQNNTISNSIQIQSLSKTSMVEWNSSSMQEVHLLKQLNQQSSSLKLNLQQKVA
jgi:hypothetical protein